MGEVGRCTLAFAAGFMDGVFGFVVFQSGDGHRNGYMCICRVEAECRELSSSRGGAGFKTR